MYSFEELPQPAIESIFKHADIDTSMILHKKYKFSEYMWREKINEQYKCTPEELVCEDDYSESKITENEMIGCIYAGIDLTKRDIRKDTLLHIACYRGFFNVCELLIALNKIDINALDSGKITPVSTACASLNYKLVKLLIENGADITIEDEWGENPLDDARMWEHDEMVEYLEGFLNNGK